MQRIPIYRHLDFRVIGRLRRALRDLRPDIVHTHLIHADLYGTLAAKLSGVRTRHFQPPQRRQFPPPAAGAPAATACSGASTSAGIAISQAIARFCVEVEGAPARKITTIYYGLPLHVVDRKAGAGGAAPELELPADAPLVGMVCRLIEQKGVVYGLRAFARIAPQFPGAQLVIAGDGPRRAALEAEAKTLGMADRVHFLGWRDDTPRGPGGARRAADAEPVGRLRAGHAGSDGADRADHRQRRQRDPRSGRRSAKPGGSSRRATRPRWRSALAQLLGDEAAAPAHGAAGTGSRRNASSASSAWSTETLGVYRPLALNTN